MDDRYAKFQKSLKTYGYSVTKPRLAVFSAMLDREPLVVQQLIDTVGKDIDRASVYRTIKLFERISVIQRLVHGWKYKLELSDEFSSHHHHISCIRCGTLQTFEESTAISRELKRLAQSAGFNETSHQLEIRGICQKCQI